MYTSNTPNLDALLYQRQPQQSFLNRYKNGEVTLGETEPVPV